MTGGFGLNQLTKFSLICAREQPDCAAGPVKFFKTTYQVSHLLVFFYTIHGKKMVQNNARYRQNHHGV